MSEPVYALPAVDLEKWSHCRTLGPQKRDALIAEIRRLQTEVAALTSSPSEPLVEVEDAEDLVDKLVYVGPSKSPVNDGAPMFRIPGDPEHISRTLGNALAALITARDAQVAARVREELGEDDYLLTLSMDERHWLSELVESRRDELRRLLSGWLEHDDREAYEKESDIAERVNDECMCLVGKGINARTALTATGGGECVLSPVLSDQLDSTPLTVEEKP